MSYDDNAPDPAGAPELGELKPPLTMDEARAAVGRMLARSLEASIIETEAELEKAPEGDDARDTRTFLAAAKELHDALLIQAKRFERPLILRPRRSLRVVR